MTALLRDAPAAIPPLTNSLEQAALKLAARGWRVFPCKPRGKKPITRNGCKAATTDAATISKWWAKWPDANIGVATGNGLVVVDIDGPAGEASIAGRDLPPAPTVTTGRPDGGRHLYLADPAGTLTNDHKSLPDVHIQAAGLYVIAAPSVHPSGAVYAWVPGLSPDDLTPPPAPQWLYDLAAPRGDIPPPAPPEEAPSTIPIGRRNDTLARLAGGLRADGLELGAITAELLATNKSRCSPPLPEGEVRSIAASIVRYAAAPNGPTVRVARKLLKSGLTDGAVALYATRQAIAQSTGGHPKQQAQAQALGVGLRSVKQWTAELKAADLDKYERPSRRYVAAPVGLLTDPEVSHEAKVTALHLLACADSEGAANVGVEALTVLRGKGNSTVRRHLDELRERGHLLRQVAPFNAELGKRERCNRYRLLATAPPVAVGLTPQKVQQVSDSKPAVVQKVQQVGGESRPLGAVAAVAVSPHAPQEHSDKPFPTKATHVRSAIVANAAAADRKPWRPRARTPLFAAQAIATFAAVPVPYVAALIRRHGLAEVEKSLGYRHQTGQTEVDEHERTQPERAIRDGQPRRPWQPTRRAGGRVAIRAA